MSDPLSPTPIPAHTVTHLLHYISPPSALSHPLPTHLLSLPLLQRHHFLRLDPSHDVLAYLSWPSPQSQEPNSNQARVLDLLELVSSSPSDLDGEGYYDTRYTADTESVRAHVHVPTFPSSPADGLRLVFQWHPEGWKYHDAALMPFPPTSHPSLPSALQIQDPSSASEDADDDSYWNAYGADDDDDPLSASASNLHTTASSKTDDASEDAYWAQYASVHGTADSTIPSPRRPSHPHQSHLHPHLFSHSQLNPNPNPDPDLTTAPSPRHLAHLLHALASPSAEAESDFTHSNFNFNFDRRSELGSSPDSSSEDTSTLAASLEADGLKEGAGLGLDFIATSIQVQVDPVPVPVSLNSSNRDPDPDPDTDTEALKQTLSGLYRLYLRHGRTKNPKEGFLRIVRDVVDSESGGVVA